MPQPGKRAGAAERLGAPAEAADLQLEPVHVRELERQAVPAGLKLEPPTRQLDRGHLGAALAPRQHVDIRAHPAALEGDLDPAPVHVEVAVGDPEAVRSPSKAAYGRCSGNWANWGEKGARIQAAPSSSATVCPSVPRSANGFSTAPSRGDRVVRPSVRPGSGSAATTEHALAVGVAHHDLAAGCGRRSSAARSVACIEDRPILGKHRTQPSPAGPRPTLHDEPRAGGLDPYERASVRQVVATHPREWTAEARTALRRAERGIGRQLCTRGGGLDRPASRAVVVGSGHHGADPEQGGAAVRAARDCTTLVTSPSSVNCRSTACRSE